MVPADPVHRLCGGRAAGSAPAAAATRLGQARGLGGELQMRPRVARLAAEVGLGPAQLTTPVAASSPDVVARVRLARALALDPTVLLVEHPSASLPRDAVKAFAAHLGRIARARQIAVLVVTADEAFASALGGTVLTHGAATGALKPRSAWRKIFG